MVAPWSLRTPSRRTQVTSRRSVSTCSSEARPAWTGDPAEQRNHRGRRKRRRRMKMTKRKDGAAAAVGAATEVIAGPAIDTVTAGTMAGISSGVMSGVKVSSHRCFLSSTHHLLFSFPLILLLLRHYFVRHYSSLMSLYDYQYIVWNTSYQLNCHGVCGTP